MSLCWDEVKGGIFIAHSILGTLNVRGRSMCFRMQYSPFHGTNFRSTIYGINIGVNGQAVESKRWQPEPKPI